MDDSFGAIVYILKREGVIAGGPAFTVNLNVNYHKPVPATSIVCCTTTVSSIEGRKIFGTATVEVRSCHARIGAAA